MGASPIMTEKAGQSPKYFLIESWSWPWPVQRVRSRPRLPLRRATFAAGLFVRGGDRSETSILLDGATVARPYKYELPTGGVFGIIPPFLVRGTVFSTGGFSARYGNALSGVLAMESLDLLAEREVVARIGLPKRTSHRHGFNQLDRPRHI